MSLFQKKYRKSICDAQTRDWRSHMLVPPPFTKMLPTYDFAQMICHSKLSKNASHDMAIVGNHATSMLMAIFLIYSWLCCAHSCVYTCTVHCTHWLWLYSCFVDRSEHHIHPGDTTHHTHTTQIPHRQSKMLSSGCPTKNLGAGWVGWSNLSLEAETKLCRAQLKLISRLFSWS